MTDKHVKKKIGDRSVSVIFGEKIKQLRTRIGANQKTFALHLGVSQGTVSEWEKGEYDPSPMALMAIGRVDYENTFWWYEQAGPEFAEQLRNSWLLQKIRSERLENAKNDSRAVWVPLYRDPVAAGTGRVVSESDIEREIPFDKDLLPHGAKPRAFHVRGASMAPIVNDGYIVLVDIAQQDPRRAVGHMVAAREGDGVTIKWLRKDKDTYLLVPQHVSQDFPVRIIRPEDDWAIVGVVLKWVGYPSAPRK